MKTAVYLLKCLTNMHVGNGEESYNIIDNEVEKDVVTGNPAIYSSGIKGSLLQHFKNQKDVRKETVENIFGNEFGGPVVKEGRFKFLQAQLLARPMRVSCGEVTYAMVTTNEILRSFAEHMVTFGFKKEDYELSNESQGNDFDFVVKEHSKIKEIEGYPAKNILNENMIPKKIQVPDNFAIASSSIFQSIDLPVLARNCLENGKSKNLWYEQIMPHESLFYMTVLYPDDCEEFDDFHKIVTNNIIQFGGNASIGYGYTKITCLEGGVQSE